MGRDVRACRSFRVLFLVRMMMTPAVMSVIWRTIVPATRGPPNPIPQVIGVGAQPWLSDAGGAFAGVMIVEVLQWTPSVVRSLPAGLPSLPSEQSPAGRIDGAGPVRTFRSVILPMTGAIPVGAILIRLIEVSKAMETVHVPASGGPGTCTKASGCHVNIRRMRYCRFGYLAALLLTSPVLMTVALTVIAKVPLHWTLRDRGWGHQSRR